MIASLAVRSPKSPDPQVLLVRDQDRWTVPHTCVEGEPNSFSTIFQHFSRELPGVRVLIDPVSWEMHFRGRSLQCVYRAVTVFSVDVHGDVPAEKAHAFRFVPFSELDQHPLTFETERILTRWRKNKNGSHSG